MINARSETVDEKPSYRNALTLSVSKLVSQNKKLGRNLIKKDSPSFFSCYLIIPTQSLLVA